mmetsp:Transcript_52166/g.82836  ORF Transcript_52166/g.82836 Transcript_52166/m.82836 type:complete len:94 (+) Transcript_52166:59-340(+)|eukprot:CAMPEP_0169119648 /NCGR_PEP_ID=MMETSP1015-20121227/31675_1 /TAXON_ID=342587 /ORGANISM="Karlodinium micrum, Strain CCMP2283" /LENGTH=93 /DNA_ID=CAMNT_0009182555 /DNA_START=59 /DNA_END=340 /DNA_ORIENTATION=+
MAETRLATAKDRSAFIKTELTPLLSELSAQYYAEPTPKEDIVAFLIESLVRMRKLRRPPEGALTDNEQEELSVMEESIEQLKGRLQKAKEALQ